MKNVIISLLILTGYSLEAQTYSTRSAEVKFYSHAPLEDIEAHNTKGGASLSLEKNEIRIVIPIKGFMFQKALMQEHFNENYMETPKFPVATFTGSLSDTEVLKDDSPGPHKLIAKGELTIHGVKKYREIYCILSREPTGGIKVIAVFPVKVADHKIKIPSAVGKNIAEEVEITFNAILEVAP